MALDYKTPQTIADQYLLHVKTLKPEVDISQTDSDWFVRAQVVGGVFSGLYADQKKIADDAFPQSARHDALASHIDLYFGGGFKTATQSQGTVHLTGATGTSVSAGQQIQYVPNGNLYSVVSTVAFAPAATGADVLVRSVATGQAQNLLSGAQFQVVSPPAGLNPAAVAVTNLSDGRDDETDPEAALRILEAIRLPIAGGKVSDYEQFALAADPAVTAASILRYPFGLGTVGVVITSGTTDIDSALNNGIPVVETPSDALVATVQAYVESQAPVTDCPTVLKPATVGVDVTVRVRFATGSAATQIIDPVNTVNPGSMLSQGDFVKREVQRAIFKTPIGGRRFGASGYVVASEIEELIDGNLGAEAYNTGAIVQIILDRDVDDLSASGPNRSLLGNQLALPATITVVEVT